MTRTLLVFAGLSSATACAATPSAPTAARSPDAAPAAEQAAMPTVAGTGLVRKLMPAEDPGPPFYARVGLQVLERDGWVGIPFYRSPDLVPADFNLLGFYDFPGPAGPGAFAAPLLMTGFLLIEADAPLGTFPKQVEMRGTGTPIWFVPTAAYQGAAGDGVLTLAELRSLAPLYGTTTRYHETLHPRDDAHKIVIDAEGTLPDGRTFRFGVTQVDDEPPRTRITFR